MNTETLQARASRLVQNEVHLCLSSLVSTLAGGYGCTPGRTKGHADLGELAEQAFELACPVLDYEEAALQDGANIVRREDGLFWPSSFSEDEGNVPYDTAAEAAEDWCTNRGIEPYDREVFEHWAVSDWLADKLIEKGEKVDKDFANLCVWARTTTGQAISIDYVIEQITTELHA